MMLVARRAEELDGIAVRRPCNFSYSEPVRKEEGGVMITSIDLTFKLNLKSKTLTPIAVQLADLGGWSLMVSLNQGSTVKDRASIDRETLQCSRLSFLLH